MNETLFGGRALRTTRDSRVWALEGSGPVALLSVVAGDLLPLEFVYDRPLNEPHGSVPGLCPHATQAGRDGHCCESGQGDDVVCPFGFWGVRRVIERHMSNGEEPIPGTWARALGPVATMREGLSLLRSVLGAASPNADESADTPWTTLKNRLTNKLPGDVRFVEDWQSWTDQLRAAPADILLLLPHVVSLDGEPTLELRLNDRIDLDAYMPQYVRGNAHVTRRKPIVLLLGCATAAGTPLLEFPMKFIVGGACVVIATLTPVRGRQVAPLGTELTFRILEGSKTHGIQVGELMRQLRQRAFADHDPTALSLVAFGDSAWVLKAR